jgi:hypothetical protein
VTVPYTGYHHPAYNIIARPTGALGDGFRIGGGISVADVVVVGAIGLLSYLVLGSLLYPPKPSRMPPPPAGAGTFMR